MKNSGSMIVYPWGMLLDSPKMEPSDKRPFIFTVTSLDIQRKLPNGQPAHPTSRCWGWFETLEQAEEYLYKDYGDIHEGGTNTWAVIEKSESGICPSFYQSETRWYQFIPNEDGFHRFNGYTVQQIECPEQFKNVLGWGLG